MVRNVSGDPAYFISVIEDITQRKQGEEELRRSNSDFELCCNELRRVSSLLKYTQSVSLCQSRDLQSVGIFRKRIDPNDGI